MRRQGLFVLRAPNMTLMMAPALCVSVTPCGLPRITADASPGLRSTALPSHWPRAGIGRRDAAAGAVCASSAEHDPNDGASPLCLRDSVRTTEDHGRRIPWAVRDGVAVSLAQGWHRSPRQGRRGHLCTPTCVYSCIAGIKQRVWPGTLRQQDTPSPRLPRWSEDWSATITPTYPVGRVPVVTGRVLIVVLGQL